MKTAYYIAMLPDERRYSAQWHGLWKEILLQAFDVVTTIDGYDENITGQVVNRTRADTSSIPIDDLLSSLWMATQLRHVTKAFANGEIQNGDVFVLTEGHSLIVPELARLRYTTGIAFKIAILLHAGTWDPWDYLNGGKGIGTDDFLSIQHVERATIAAADAVLLATEFHRNLIARWLVEDERISREVIEDKLRVVPYPLNLTMLDSHRKPWSERERIVVFPHRLTEAKGLFRYNAIAQEVKRRGIGDVVSTHENAKYRPGWDLTDYHAHLGAARAVLSCARQETWGIAQLEGWYLGAYPIVPAALSYREIYAPSQQYDTIEEAVELIAQAMDATEPSTFAPAFHPCKHGELVQALRGI